MYLLPSTKVTKVKKTKAFETKSNIKEVTLYVQTKFLSNNWKYTFIYLPNTYYCKYPNQINVAYESLKPLTLLHTFQNIFLKIKSIIRFFFVEKYNNRLIKNKNKTEVTLPKFLEI